MRSKSENGPFRFHPEDSLLFIRTFRKDQFCFKHIQEPAVRRGSRLVCSSSGFDDRVRPRFRLSPSPIRPTPSLPSRLDVLPLHDVNLLSHARSAQNPSGYPSLKAAKNRRLRRSSPPPGASPDEDRTILKLMFHRKRHPRWRLRRRELPVLRTGGARRDRTDDLMLAKHALSQLSYGPSFLKK